MAKSVLDIVIRTIKEGGGDKEVVKGLVSMKSAITTAGTAFAALAGAAYAVDKALDATVGKAVEYANKVEGISNATGLSAENASRTIQVLDDLRVSYDDLTASAKKNSDTDFSVEGLAQASAEYKSLATEQERQAFAQEKYGKQWVEFTKVLDAGPEKIRAMSAATSESLILTEDNINQAREYQMALDEWNDAVDALAIGIGNDLLPKLTEMAVGIANSSAIRAEANRLMQEGIAGNREEAMAMASATVQAEAHANAMNGSTEALTANGEAALTTATDYAGLLGMMQQLNDATLQEIKNTAYKQLQNDLAKSGNELTADEAKLLREAGIEMGVFTEKSALTAEQIDLLNKQLEEGILTLDDYIQKLNDIPETVNTTITRNMPTDTTNPVPQAIGGMQKAGQPYLVHKDEIIVPATNGYTLTRTDARNAVSGGGVNNRGGVTIYGGVTVCTQGSVVSVLEELGA